MIRVKNLRQVRDAALPEGEYKATWHGFTLYITHGVDTYEARVGAAQGNRTNCVLRVDADGNMFVKVPRS